MMLAFSSFNYYFLSILANLENYQVVTQSGRLYRLSIGQMYNVGGCTMEASARPTLLFKFIQLCMVTEVKVLSAFSMNCLLQKINDNTFKKSSNKLSSITGHYRQKRRLC